MAREGERSARFSLTLPLVKVWQDDTGELWFEGVASSTRLDRQQERMTPKAIEKMVAQRGIELLPSHSAGPLEGLGVVEEAWADNDQFRVAGRLDKTSSTATRLFERVRSGRSYGLSVGGRVRKAYWEYDQEAGRRVRHIDDVELDHVAVCRPEAAANPDTYLSVIAKAAEELAPMPSGSAGEGDDLLVRIGKAAVDAARHLWPFGRSGEDEETGPAEETPVESELAELRKEVLAALVEVREALAEVREQEEEESATETPTKGRPQALAGQEMPGSVAGDPWRGVV